MKLFGQTIEGFAKAVVALLSVFVLSCALWGVSYFLQPSENGGLHASTTPISGLFIATGIASSVTMTLSALGTLLVALAWLIRAAFRKSSRPSKTLGAGAPAADRNREN